MQIQVFDKEKNCTVIYDSEFTPMRLCLSEDDKKDIASMIGMKNGEGNPIDLYNVYPKDMSEEAFNKIMMEEKK